MKGYVTNIEKDTLANEDFRRVLYTAKNSQLVLMSLLSGEEIGAEVHQLDQFIRVERGQGKAVLDGAEYILSDGYVIVVPAGARHNIINTGAEAMKLYTLYAPPNHKDGTVHHSKADAAGDEEHFDGQVTEGVEYAATKGEILKS
ncbi:MAG: cupin domain-containing protein [Patescibacteria group bacterium]